MTTQNARNVGRRVEVVANESSAKHGDLSETKKFGIVEKRPLFLPYVNCIHNPLNFFVITTFWCFYFQDDLTMRRILVLSLVMLIIVSFLRERFVFYHMSTGV